MRITTKAVLRNYRTSLSKAQENMENARTKFLSGRNFETMSEDPASSIKAFKMRREYDLNDQYMENVKTAQPILNALEDGAAQITKEINTVKDNILTVNNGTSDLSQRKIFANNFRGAMESIVRSLNSTFGDQFVFGGSDTTEVPFVLKKDDTSGKYTLTYRGIDVSQTTNQVKTTMDTDIAKINDLTKSIADANLTISTSGVAADIDAAKLTQEAASKELKTMMGVDVATDPNTGLMTVSLPSAANPAGSTTLVGGTNGAQSSTLSLTGDTGKYGISSTFPGEAAVDISKDMALDPRGASYMQATLKTLNDYPTDLDRMANEKMYTDIGFGLYDKSGNMTNSTAFNLGYSGLNLLGYGTNEDGSSKNLVLLLAQAADALEQEPMDTEMTDKVFKQFDDSFQKVLNFTTDVGTQSAFLKNTLGRLEDSNMLLNEKLSNLELGNPALQISEFTFAENAYNAALKVGSGILSNSFIDFMR